MYLLHPVGINKNLILSVAVCRTLTDHNPALSGRMIAVPELVWTFLTIPLSRRTRMRRGRQRLTKSGGVNDWLVLSVDSKGHGIPGAGLPS